MKTIICPNYIKNDLIEISLENDYLLNTKIIPLNSYLNFKNTISNEELTILAYKKLKENFNLLKLYKDMIKYPSFIEELLTFTKDVILYDIDINSLPINTIQQKELKTIIEILHTLPFNEKLNKDYTIQKNIKDTEIFDFFAKSLFEYNIKDKLLKSNCKLINIHSNKNPKINIKYALNQREEIESIAQDICNKKNALNTTIVCSDINNQYPIIKQVFKRYNIPIKSFKSSSISNIAILFITLCKLSLNKDIETLIDFLSFLPLKHSYKTISYINRYINSPFELLNNDNFDEDVKQDIDLFKNHLEILLKDKSFKDILITSYSLLENFEYLNETKSILKIKEILENCINYIEDKTDLEYILYFVNKIKTPLIEDISKGVLITSIDKPVFSRQYSYVIGCTSKLYPNFKNLSGIFDETYVSLITNYPSLETRHNIYFKQLKWIEKSASEEIIFSYFTSDLSGKNIESSFEIEKYGKASKWDILYINKFENREHKITKDTASKLFFNNNKLKGSISAFETYFKCPYDYFLRYGLKIKEYQEIEINIATIGNIVHFVMQKLIEKYKKDYYKCTNNDIENFLNEYKLNLLKDFPKQKYMIDLMFKTIKDNIILNFEYIKEMEIETSFIPLYTEYKFDNFEIIDNVLIKGFIDRIDINNNSIRIIDYKSSEKILSKPNIEKGLQLQLLTYIIVASKIFNKNPMGVFYYSFKNKILANTDNVLKEFINSKRLNGAIFDNHEINKELYKTLKENFSYDVVENGIFTIYQKLYEELKNGNIELKPVKDYLKFSPYKAILRYSGEEFEKESIFQFNEVNDDEIQ